MDMMKGLGAGLALGTVLGVALEIAYERWQERKFSREIAESAEIAMQGYRGDDDDKKQDSATYRIEPNGTVTYVSDGSISAPGIAEINPVADHDGDDPGMPYTDYAGLYKPKADDEYKIPDNGESEFPVVRIDEAEFDVNHAYEKVFCTYAQDDNGLWELTNDDGNVSMDVDRTVGPWILSAFGVEPESNVVFARNEEKMVDYMIQKFEYVE